MTDLRALLGDDRYDEVLTKATKRALFNYPNLPISIVEHEALAAQALAAVLPELLADVWDEGYHAGHEDARAVQPTYPDPTPNPYRQDSEGTEAGA